MYCTSLQLLVLNVSKRFLPEKIYFAEQIQYYENFDLESVVTPVDINMLEKLLYESGYDSGKSQFLINSFKHGFNLGYRGPQKVRLTAPNLKLQKSSDRVTLWNKVMKEVKNKWYAGPFSEIPYKEYIQSPIGLVPKDNGRDSRLIFHLSYPHSKLQCLSVNANTPVHFCTVKYPDFTKAIELCIKAGIGCKISKSDMKSAFRNLGISKRFWRYLIMKAQSPIDGKTYYFVDKCLPFGAAISCSHFQKFSDAVSHIVKYKTGGKVNINYLDDFLFITLLKAMCNAQVNMFLEVCRLINFPVSLDKTVFACTQLIFLEFLINSVRQLVLIPIEKIHKA